LYSFVSLLSLSETKGFFCFIDGINDVCILFASLLSLSEVKGFL